MSEPTSAAALRVLPLPAILLDTHGAILAANAHAAELLRAVPWAEWRWIQPWQPGPGRATVGGGTWLTHAGPTPEGDTLLTLTRVDAPDPHLSRLAQVAERTTNGVVLTDIDGMIIWVNAAFTHTTGYTLAEIGGRRAPEVLTGPGTDPETLARVGRAIEAHDSFDERFLQYHKDGSPIWVRCIASPLVDADGAYAGHLSIQVDETAKHVADQERRHQTALLEIAERLSRVGAWSFDPAQRRFQISDTTAEILELQPGEVPDPATAVARYAPEHRALVEHALRACIEYGTSWDYELPIRTFRDHQVWVRVIGQAERSKGRTELVVGACQDITARKLHEIALHRREERLALALADGHAHGVWDYDVDAADLYLSEGWTADLEWHPGGQPRLLLSRIRAEAAEALLEAGHAIAAGVRPAMELDVQLRTRRGERWVTIRGRGIRDDRGRVRRLVGTLTDITERRAAEADRARLERALLDAQRDQTIGRIASGVAHDFNNLLTVIGANVSFAEDESASSVERSAALSQIRDTTQRLASLTRQLLAYARRQPTRPVVLDASEALARLLPLLNRLAGPRVTLTWHPEDRALPVLIDPAQLDQVITNVVVNARDAMPNGGALRLSTRRVRLDTDDLPADMEPGFYAEIQVTDTGVGIPSDVLPHVFEPYFTTKRGSSGTGLGLATVQGIVRQHRGQVHVTSTLGQGTTLRVLLPDAAALPTRPTVPEPSATRAPTGVRVLIVDDDPDVLVSTRTMLSAAGFEVVAAGSARAAIAQVLSDARPISVLLTDVVMPDLNGPELAQAIRVTHPGLPVVFMSGYPDAVLERYEQQVRGIELVSKPFTSDELVRALSDALTP